MSRYLAVLFSDMERHTVAWSRAPRDTMVALIAEYRYLAESLSGRYGCLYREWAGDGHMFLFESPDAAVRFALDLIDAWRKVRATAPALSGAPDIPLRVGCHFGECTPFEGGAGWMGRGNAIAKRVESEADSDNLCVTESVLDLIDLPLYEFEAIGSRMLKGDVLEQRQLYRINRFDGSALDARPLKEMTAQDWFLKGVDLIGSDREWSGEEADCYRAALRLRPDYAEAHNNLATVLHAMNEDEAAGTHYQEALRIRPDYPEANYNYGLLLEARGALDGAGEHYQRALAARPEYVDAHHAYANQLRRRGDLEASEIHYREALRVRPTDVEARHDYAILLEDRGDLPAAEEQYREALRAKADQLATHYNYALLLERRGDILAAESHYRDALRVNADYPEAHNNLAALLHTRGDLAEAEHHYREALRLRPMDPEAHQNLALLLRASGRDTEAEEHLRRARELTPLRAAR